MTTVETMLRPEVPPKTIDGAECCAAGHPWEPETTRWRYRDRPNRPGHSWSGWERDCLVCKHMADKRRAKNCADRQHQQLLVDVTQSGTHWGTTGGAA